MAIWNSLLELFRVSLEALHAVTGSYGWAIVLITVAVRLLILPLTWSQSLSMKKMQVLQPELQKLQQKYKNDREKLNQEMMKLWQEHKVNPMGGCLPILVQLPFLYAIYAVLRDFPALRGAPFYWVHSLGSPDPFYVLPVLAAISTYVQSKVTMPANLQGPQQTMILLMPFFIGYISLQFPAGLVLYWVVSNLFGIAQQLLIPGLRPAPAGAGAAGGGSAPSPAKRSKGETGRGKGKR